MATLGKIKCDICGHIADLEMYNGNANMRTPEGWASIYPTIRIAGERSLKSGERSIIKNRIGKKFPSIHLCPTCLSTESHWKGDGPLVLTRGQGNENVVNA